MLLPHSTQDMIIGVHQRPGDLAVNVCKTKALTNMRAAGSDDTIKVPAPPTLSHPVSLASSVCLLHLLSHSLTHSQNSLTLSNSLTPRSSRPWS